MSGGAMSDEGFFRRWARLKSTGGEGAPAEAPRAPPAPALAPRPVAAPDAANAANAAGPDAEAKPAPRPTLEDAARLTPDADFSAFVARDVDKSVQRLALKKLFADPHFNAIDGLDMYMSDYNKPSPMTPDMLASLKHAPGLLARLFGDQEEEANTADTADAITTQAPAPETGQEHEQRHAHTQPSIQQGNA